MGCSCGILAAQPLGTGLALDLPVDNGLIRWWPNLFDARDEITGQEGVVMGVLPPVETGADDETEFSRHTGWVQLQPAITNEVFTLSFWVRLRADAVDTRLLGQEANEGQWIFQYFGGGPCAFFIGPYHFQEADRSEQVVLTPKVWHHVAVARRAEGTSDVWVDGARTLEGQLAHPWPTNARWLSVGNSLSGGDELSHHDLRDLCAFDRVLTDEEARALHAAGLPHRRARNTATRLAATRRPIPIEVSTNVVKAPPQLWTHRRFTTED